MKNKNHFCSFTDVHAHILPGLDDGPKDIRETEKLLRQAWSEGIHTIIATSHFNPKYWDYDPERYNAVLYETRQLAKEIDEEFRIVEGSEIFYREDTIHALLHGKCRTLPNRFALIEFQVNSEFERILHAVQALLLNDYKPLLAHIERYGCIQRKPAAVRDLVDEGAWIQVNTGSLQGNRASFSEKRTARWLLKAGLVDAVATDCHNTLHRPPLYKKCAEYIMGHCPEPYARQILYENPGQISGLQ
ncbi:MAG: hypothetical protein LUF78_06495 [Clostridiales bacterium]|nr:hypothetical protein [Clostridiales bacterium]